MYDAAPAFMLVVYVFHYLSVLAMLAADVRMQLSPTVSPRRSHGRRTYARVAFKRTQRPLKLIRAVLHALLAPWLQCQFLVGILRSITGCWKREGATNLLLPWKCYKSRAGCTQVTYLTTRC